MALLHEVTARPRFQPASRRKTTGSPRGHLASRSWVVIARRRWGPSDPGSVYDRSTIASNHRALAPGIWAVSGWRGRLRGVMRRDEALGGRAAGALGGTPRRRRGRFRSDSQAGPGRPQNTRRANPSRIRGGRIWSSSGRWPRALGCVSVGSRPLAGGEVDRAKSPGLVYGDHRSGVPSF